MNKPPAGKLNPSPRITAGLLMLIAGFACIAFVVLLGGILGYAAILPVLGGPVLTLTGIFQMIRGLRERATTQRAVTVRDK